MPEYLAPGVYVEEIPAVKFLEGVSTSTVAIVEQTTFGPVSRRPSVLASFSEFRNTYGGLDDLEYSSSVAATSAPNYTAHAVRAFFDNGGQRIYVSRVFALDASDYSKHQAKLPLVAASSSMKATAQARYPASWDNQLRVVFKLASATNLIGKDTNDNAILRGLYNGAMVQISTTAVANASLLSGDPSNPSSTPTIHYVDYLNGVATLFDVPTPPPMPKSLPAGTYLVELTAQVFVGDASAHEANYTNLSTGPNAANFVATFFDADQPTDAAALLWSTGVDTTTDGLQLLRYLCSKLAPTPMTGGDDDQVPAASDYQGTALLTGSRLQPKRSCRVASGPATGKPTRRAFAHRATNSMRMRMQARSGPRRKEHAREAHGAKDFPGWPAACSCRRLHRGRRTRSMKRSYWHWARVVGLLVLAACHGAGEAAREVTGETTEALLSGGCPNIAAANQTTSCAFYDGFENPPTGSAAESYLSQQWTLVSPMTQTGQPVSQYPAASQDSTAWGNGTAGWTPTYGENVSIARHINLPPGGAGETIPGAPPPGQPGFPGSLGGDYWNTAYPIGVIGDYYFSTGDVRPSQQDPWNFNPGATAGSFVQDTADDGLVFEAVSSPIPANTSMPATRYVSFLIGGYGRNALDVSHVPYVSYEVEYLSADPGCTGTAYTPLTGVNLYYGYKGTWGSITARLTAAVADVKGTTALIKPTPTGTETMTLIIIDLWAGKSDGPQGNPNAGTVCPNGRIHIYDGSPVSHLNVDEIMVSDVSGITNNYPSTPFGAAVTPMSAPNTPLAGAVSDHPPAVYGYADLHTHWMAHMGNGGDALPTVNANGNRKKLDGLLSQMSFMWGMPYGPSTLPPNEVCPSMNNGKPGVNTCGATSDPNIATCTGGPGGTCTFSDLQRDKFLLAACDGNHSETGGVVTAGPTITSGTIGGGSRHEGRSNPQYNDQNYRSSDTASKFLQLMTKNDNGFGRDLCPSTFFTGGLFGCWHGWWGYDETSDMFELPFMPFMSTIHQQMYWKWVKRAWQGGLRLLVADVLHNLGSELVLNNYWVIPNPSNAGDWPDTFPDAITMHATDEQTAVQRQVCALEKMLLQSENNEMGFAQIVTTPAQARTVIASGRLAIVLGTEIDSLGSLRAGGLPPNYSAAAEVKFLHDLGITKVTPIHALDNTLGGAALNVVTYAQESDALNLAGNMMDGANCVAQGNFAAKMAQPDPFFLTNNWVYTNNMNFINQFVGGASKPSATRPQDIVAHLANGQISCTGTYDPFEHFDPSSGTFADCANQWSNGAAPGTGNYKSYDTQFGCWSNIHLPGAQRAPFIDQFNTVTYSIGNDFLSSSMNAYNASNNWVYGRLSWIRPSWLDAGVQWLVPNNDNYLPWFDDCHGTPASGISNCIASPTTSPMQYLGNPAIAPGSDPTANGTINSVGLTTPAGSDYLRALQQFAMLIDIDHASAKARQAAYAEMWPSGSSCPTAMTQQTEPFAAASLACQKGAYPMFSTHSEPRALKKEPLGASANSVMARNERTVEDYEYLEIPQLGGVVGMSTGYGSFVSAPGLYASPVPAGPYGTGVNHPLNSGLGDPANSCPGSSASFLQAYLYAAYLGEQSRPFYDFGGPAGVLRPSQWRSPGIALGSDMNGVREQLGARFANTGYACMDLADSTTQAFWAGLQQGAKNAVLYDSISPVDQAFVASSQSPPNNVPPQPPLHVMRWNPNKTPDIQVNQAPDAIYATQTPVFTLTGFDVNQIGLANIGLEPDMLQDAVNTERSTWNQFEDDATVTTFQGARYSMRYLFRSTEDFIEGWEKAVAWCQANFPGSQSCVGAQINTDIRCDPWPTDVDGIGPDATERTEPNVSTGLEHAITDQTPSCQNRCGETLFFKVTSKGGNQVTESCNCFMDAQDAVAGKAKLCDDFKPMCEWFFQGGSTPSGEIVGSAEEAQVSDGCANGATPDQIYGLGMIACGGSVSYANAANLCDAASGYVPCTAAEWVARPGGGAPVNDYWLADNLDWVSGGGTGNCETVDYPAGIPCSSGPMMICAHSGADAYGNNCNSWIGCGFNSTANQYLGGCNSPNPSVGAASAGTMCCLGASVLQVSTCSGDAFAEQQFTPGVGGCAGSVPFDKAQSLCAAGCTVCSAQQWASKVVPTIGSNTPQYDYWVSNAPDYSGSGSQSCSALASGGNPCGTNGLASDNNGPSPMRVCVDHGTTWDAADSLGNTCNWDDCGMGGSSPNAFMGGCGSNNPTAGALCCCGN
jgi:hypothetical protein